MPTIKHPLSKWLADLGERLPQALPIYRSKPVERGPEQIKALAERLKVRGELQQPDKERTLVVDGRRVLIHYNQSGGFRFADLSAKEAPHERKVALPSVDEARERAEKFLKEQGWLPEGAKIDHAAVISAELASGPRHAERREIPQVIGVDFRLHLGAHTTYGPGAKIKVEIGDRGAVVGVFHAIRDFEKIGEAKVRPAKDLARILGLRLGRSLDAIELEGALMAYYCESPALDRRIAQPVHVLTLGTITKGRGGARMVSYMTHPLPVTDAAPLVAIPTRGEGPITIDEGKALHLGAEVSGGRGAIRYRWSSNFAGPLGEGPELKTDALKAVIREGKPVAHTVKVTISDAEGNEDSDQVMVAVKGEGLRLQPIDPHRIVVGERIIATPGIARPTVVPDDDPYVGVEWCNLYNGAPGLGDISGTDNSAEGFARVIRGLSGWSQRFDWGNNAAWEQDFKRVGAPGGGTDTYWADHVHFAFFAGHGSPGRFYFGSTVDDHEMRAEDATWGDGILNWIVLHACQTMRNNFGWTVWCDAFKGLHQIFGFHTNTEGSSPPLGERFALWSSFVMPIIGGGTSLFTLREAWAIAAQECFDASVEYASIYAGQSGTDTHNDHLPGFGHVSADPSSPNFWVYQKSSC
ncbi:MAG: hypothetical protein KC420_11065 [Myxococcales bacterium]|nr:hypothetical protein [Myxococcales bacterium]